MKLGPMERNVAVALRRLSLAGPRPRRRRPALSGRPEQLEARRLLTLTIFEYPVPTLGSLPTEVAPGPDGAVYATLPGNASNARTLARIVPGAGNTATISELQALTTAPIDVITGPDGNLWFTQVALAGMTEPVVRYNLATGVPTAFGPAGGTLPSQIVVGPDNSLYFTNNGANFVSRVTTDGTFTTIPVDQTQFSIAVGPDGNIWFAERDTGNNTTALRRIFTATQTLDPATSIVLGDAQIAVESLVVGPDGNFWFTSNDSRIGMGGVGRVEPVQGAIPARFSVGPTRRITTAPDQSLYFTAGQYTDPSQPQNDRPSSIGRIALDGSVEFTPTPTPNSGVWGITSTADARVFFAEQFADRIGAFALPASTPLQLQAASFAAAEGASATPVVGTFLDPLGPSPVATYTATIDWGDGSPVVPGNGVISLDGQTLVIRGTHTYERPGTYQTQVTVSNGDGRRSTAFGLAIISDAPLSANTLPVAALAGTPATAIPIASFTDAGGFDAGVTYAATINFGDGSAPVPGQVIFAGANGTSTGMVSVPSRVFATPGTFTGSVTIASSTGAQVTLPLSVAVSNLTYLPPAGPTAATAGTPLAGGSLLFPFSSATIPPAGTGYTATVDYGDGSAPVAGTVSIVGQVLTVSAPVHAYLIPGSYQARATLAIAGNPNLSSGSITVNAASPTLIPSAPLALQVDQPLTATLATVAAAPSLDARFYSAVIDYGDGTPPSLVPLVGAGASPAIAGQGKLYTRAGSFTIRVTLRSAANVDLATATVPIQVSSVPLPAIKPVFGVLTAESDRGASGLDNITNDRTPTFFGVAEPGSTVALFAALAGSAPIQVGLGNADAAGFWSITTNELIDGVYTISATSTRLADGATTTTQLLPLGATPPFAPVPFPAARGLGPLVIDTVAPTVVGLGITDVRGGRFQVTYQDNLSGLGPVGIVDGSNYALSRVGRRDRPRVSYRVASLAASPTATATDPVTVTGSVVGSNGRTRFYGGGYVFQVSARIIDVAGNGLDGEFYGTFPTGNRQSGLDFLARIRVANGRAGSPMPLGSTANPLPQPQPLVAAAQARVKALASLARPFAKSARRPG